jgi:hypothetical protein
VADVDHALRRPPGEPFALGVDPSDDLHRSRGDALTPGTPLQRIADAYQLADFDISVALLALAPELDRRYERLYAYLQDDIAARRPTVDLALQLFAADAVERLALRQRFAPQAPLIAGRVIYLDGAAPSATVLSQSIRLDEQLTNALLGHEIRDRRLEGCCRYDDAPAAPDDAEIPPDSIGRIRRFVDRQRREGHAPLLQFVGAPGSGRRATAAALAAVLCRRLMVLDLGAAGSGRDGEARVALAVRDAWLRDAVLHCDGADILRAEGGRALWKCLRPPAATSPPLVIVSLTDATTLLAPDAPRVTIPSPSYERRRLIWARAAGQSGLLVNDAGLDRLAARFELTPRQIRLAASEAGAVRLLSVEHRDQDTSRDDLPLLFASARRQSGAELAALATRIEPVHGFEDIVLPDDARLQLRELCARVEQRATVMEEWGFGARLSRGKGVNALFSGPPGTGKTMAAEVVASTLGVDLFRVELAGVVSKYIGETEKNLDRIFAAAEHANAVLLFDEADALFGKRSEVHDAHDRYANIEISYLLQRMEEYGGVAILSTNLRGNLDAAFMRRLSFTIHFPLPDVDSRRRIWQQVWPDGVPRAHDLALDLVATHFTISGGHIRNIALASAYLAASDGGVVTMRHVLAATAREYQKLGKALGNGELVHFRAWLENAT